MADPSGELERALAALRDACHRYSASLNEPCSPRENLIWAGSLLAFAAIFLTGLTAYLTVVYGTLGLAVASVPLLFALLGVAGGIACHLGQRGRRAR